MEQIPHLRKAIAQKKRARWSQDMHTKGAVCSQAGALICAQAYAPCEQAFTLR
jgi:hypothetical protein